MHRAVRQYVFAQLELFAVSRFLLLDRGTSVRPLIGSRRFATAIARGFDIPLDESYGPVHPVRLSGKLRDWVGKDEIMVNSLHWQGIARLAKPLKAEAFAEDGLVEAVRGPDDAAFCLGVQWHPEWAAKANPISVSLFRRFGAAAKGIAP